jgi:hypothetical protein
MLMTLFTIAIVFHILVLIEIIPYQMVWGGRLRDIDEMRVFEVGSLIVTLSMLFVIGIQAGILPGRIHPKVTTVLLWVMGALFLINTVGNLFSLNGTERLVFTPVTLLLSILSIRLATK